MNGRRLWHFAWYFRWEVCLRHLTYITLNTPAEHTSAQSETHTLLSYQRACVRMSSLLIAPDISRIEFRVNADVLYKPIIQSALLWLCGSKGRVMSYSLTRWQKGEARDVAQEWAREGAQGCYPDTVVKRTRTKDPPQNLATNNKVLSETFTTFINKSQWLMLALFLGISNKVWHIYTLGQCSQSPIKHVWQDGWPPRAHTNSHVGEKKGNEADKTQLMFFFPSKS